MTIKIKLVILSLVLLAAAAVPGKTAKAETFTFLMQSLYPYKVSVAFYSKSRGHVWPGVRKGYVMADSEVHEYTLKCRRGEKICYGAWVTGKTYKYWGVGFRGRKYCSNCCYICDGGESKIRVLKR